ncbi:MAG TPA: hypothetical protein VJT31_12535 [Rugosimonospora sp.]|nr:hypothetical protein [Rugosimonospora sp.]
MSYTKYEFEVLEANSLGGKADLEVWASPEESEYVEVSVTVPRAAPREHRLRT